MELINAVEPSDTTRRPKKTGVPPIRTDERIEIGSDTFLQSDSPN